MKMLNNCPPLTPEDILTLRGQPLAKMVTPSKHISQEEWIYYNPQENNKESYVFNNGKLVWYKSDER